MHKRLTGHLIIVSFDALSTADLEKAGVFSHFREFLQQAAYCKKVFSVYPSLTYPAHTSIVTGRRPKDHGIIDNTLLQPGRISPDWYWQRKYISGETLYDQAIKAGMRVAALLWPVTACSRIQYNLPEIFANRRWQSQIIVSLLNGTPGYQLELNRRFGHVRKGLSQPELDNFVQQSLLHTLVKYRPDLTLVHFTDLDTQKHLYGTTSAEAAAALARHDQRLGDIMATLRAGNLWDESTLVLLGDHGALDEDKVIYLNTLFQEKGYITLKEGRIKTWRVIAKHCDGSSYIYFNAYGNVKADQGLTKEVASLLDELKENAGSGIERVYDSREAASLGADPRCAFMVEARPGYYFDDRIGPGPVRQLEPGDPLKEKGLMAANHGYSPFKPDYTTVFAAAGQGIEPGRSVGEMSLIDEGPTLARLLGLSLAQSKGRVVAELLKKQAE